jgi:hypothetical protein
MIDNIFGDTERKNENLIIITEFYTNSFSQTPLYSNNWFIPWNIGWKAQLKNKTSC